MIINLASVSDQLYQGMFRDFPVTFCRRVLAKIGAVGNSCRMTVRLKNPKKAGFVKACLTKNGHMLTDASTDYWTWEIPSHKKALENHFRAFWDQSTLKAVSALLPDTLQAVVWVKFGNA